MTRVQAVGVLLVALGLIYGLLYAAWLRKRRQHTSAAIAAERARGDGGADVAADDTGSTAKPAAQLSVEGTYISTTTALSRLERVTVEGLGNRASATLLITRGSPEELVRIERQGESTVLITGPRLVSVRRDRGMVGKFVGSNRMLVLQWRAEDGDLYETGFLPRYKADLERVESALWWHTGEQRTEAGAEPAETTPNVSDSPATEGNSTS